VQRDDNEMSVAPPVFYLHVSGMRELLAGLDLKSVLEALADWGVIVRHEAVQKGAKVRVLYKLFRVPSEKTPLRLYQLNHAALMGEEGGPDA